MRCKKCGSLMTLYVTDDQGDRYYMCHNSNLGFFERHGKDSHFIRCNQVQDQHHNVIPVGTHLYWTSQEGRGRSFTVGNN